MISLQFGHGGGAVEDATQNVIAAAVTEDFNSATAVEPWRTRPRGDQGVDPVVLQFGHGGGAVEDCDSKED